MPVGKYAADWMGQGQFSPKTAQLYELLLRLHLAPTFGEMDIGDIPARGCADLACSAAPNRPAAGTSVRTCDLSVAMRKWLWPTFRDGVSRRAGRACAAGLVSLARTFAV
jgi:hypothetical protein